MTNCTSEKTTANYTPGPYIVDRINETSFAIMCDNPREEHTDIAVVHHRHESNEQDEFFCEADGALANALLLAAAPNLHRALHALRHGRLPDSEAALLPSEIALLVDEALAKVRG